MYKSLSEYIEFLDKKGELTRIKAFTDPVYEVTRLTDIESKKTDGGKALLFENTGKNFPIVTNIMGSEKRIQYAIGLEDASWEKLSKKVNSLMGEVTKERSSLLDKMRILPTLAGVSKWLPKKHKGKAACQELRLNSLDELPILKTWPLDGGHFITLPMVHTKDPNTGIKNLGMYRMQVMDGTTTGMHWHRHKTGERHYQLYKERGEKMPVAITLGGDPAYTFSSVSPLPDGIDEYILAGFLRNKPVSMVKCLTQDLEVPADCDFVIEGYVDPSEEKVIEGPFGDHTGFYSLEDYYPLFHVTCITARKNAIYPATIVGIPPMEDKYFTMAIEKIFLAPLKFVIAPEITNFTLWEEGVQHNFAIVQINKSYPGQAAKVASAIWGCGQMMFSKFIIVVDQKASSEDKEIIDINNRDAVFRAIALNFKAKRDSIFSSGPLDVLDHCSDICGFGGKLCIDATIKLPEEEKSLRKRETSNDIAPAEQCHKTFAKDFIEGIRILTDSDEDQYHTLWLLGSNCDPVRDSYFDGDILVLDASSKENIEGFERRWPNVVKL